MKSSLGLFYCVRCFGFVPLVGFASSNISDNINPNEFTLSDVSDGINPKKFALFDASDGLNLPGFARPKFG